MWVLFRYNWRHITRTRLLFLLLGLALGMQLIALKVSFQGSIYIGNHNVVTWGQRESLFVALFVQLFLGTFLSAVYGLWIVPYMHQGQRNQLTFTLPIPKWKFPLAYGMTLLGLLLILHVAMLASYGAVFGFSALAPSIFPWPTVAFSLVLETMAFLVVTFGFALGSMLLGPITTFFLGVFSIFLMQMSGIIFHVGDAQKALLHDESISAARRLYSVLPPVGELAFELAAQYQLANWQRVPVLIWMVWLAIFGGLFYAKLALPTGSRSVVDQ